MHASDSGPPCRASLPSGNGPRNGGTQVDKHEVVITGLGIVSPYGTDVERYYDRLAACEIALKPSPLNPDSGLWVSECDDFRPEDWMSEKIIDGTDRFSQFALAGCQQALAQAGLGGDDLDPI